MIYCQNWFVVDVVECLYCGPDCHWLTICQNSCPRGVWQHQRSGSCSLSSSASTVSRVPAMQIQVQHVFGGKSGSGKLGDEQFVDHAPAFFPDRWGSGCGGMTGDNQPHTRPTSGQ